MVDRIERDFVPLKFDATKHTKAITDARRRYKVRGYPTLMVVDGELREVARFDDRPRTREKLLNWLLASRRAI